MLRKRTDKQKCKPEAQGPKMKGRVQVERVPSNPGWTGELIRPPQAWIVVSYTRGILRDRSMFSSECVFLVDRGCRSACSSPPSSPYVRRLVLRLGLEDDEGREAYTAGTRSRWVGVRDLGRGDNSRSFQSKPNRTRGKKGSGRGRKEERMWACNGARGGWRADATLARWL